MTKSRLGRSTYLISTKFGHEPGRDKPVSYYFAALARELADRGHCVKLLSCSRGTDRRTEETAGNPEVSDWPSGATTVSSDARFLRGLISRHRPDCVVGNFSANNLSMALGWMMGVPTRVAWHHTVSGAEDMDAGRHPWRQRLFRTRRRLVYKLATHVATNSAAAACDLSRTFGIPRPRCSVFNILIADPLEWVRVHRRSGNRVVCLGRLYPSKGQDVLLRALPRIREVVPRVFVEFIGDGPSREGYERLAGELDVRDSCAFRGAFNLDEALSRLASAAVSVVPIRHEAYGLVNVESMAVGTPIVASEVGGIPEIIKEGAGGFLVRPEDPEQLAERVISLLTNRGLSGRMSAEGRARYERSFCITRNLSRHASWYEEILAPETAYRSKTTLAAPDQPSPLTLHK